MKFKSEKSRKRKYRSFHGNKNNHNFIRNLRSFQITLGRYGKKKVKLDSEPKKEQE